MPTALEVGPTAESPVTNDDIPTNEPPTEVVGVPTAESPTQRKSRNKRAIRRNSRNLLVASGHMANKGDESQVNSILPSNINIQNSRRITFSVDPGNEEAQSSTSIPSEGEAVGNTVDVEYKTNQLIDKTKK